MESHRFVTLVRTLTSSRRAVIGALGLGALTWPDLVEAKKKRKRQKRRKEEKVRFNDFGCVNAGSVCKNNDQCCSGMCEGKKARKTCRAHNTSTCQGEDACLDELNYVACTAVTGAGGQCLVTTGNASYCGASVRCHTCAQDADCVSVCGAGAACIDCADPDCLGLGYRTACASPVANACYTTI